MAVSALPDLLEIAKNSRYSNQRQSLDAIYRILIAYGPDEEITIPFVISMIDTQNKDCVEKAVVIITNWGSNAVSVLPALIKLLKDENATEKYGVYKVKKSTVSAAIMSIIFRIERNSDIDPEFLLDLLEMSEGHMIYSLSDKYLMLSGDKDKLINKLVGLIETGDGEVRERAIGVFSSRAVELKDAIPALKELVNRLEFDKRDKIIRLIEWIETKNKPKPK